MNEKLNINTAGTGKAFWKGTSVKENRAGWVCPRCGKVHAPHVNSCGCYMTHHTWVYPPYYPTYIPPIVWC